MEKFALITGASGGIGTAIARQLAKDGYSLLLHYNQNEETVIALKEELKGTVQTILLIRADLSQQKGIESFLNQVSVPIDVLIHNSGNTLPGLITDHHNEDIDDMIHLHVTAPYKITKALLPSMIRKKEGNIVVISSIWGLTGASYEVLYSMVKGAQNTFVKALAKEVALSGIRVNAVAPGAIQTKMLSNYTEEDLVMLTEEIPMGRLGYPEEVAQAVSFLISNRSSYVIGEVLSVNGGWYT
ncbi:elongation factor P 5-aminopentanone reductase [Metabacillus iocasae]|uniref:3-oxoacyl-[acyl-carrier protein] reductase n=1 Tax=Priestia iocasae TaxID=2291674 RepID=A0ABS2QSB7_9BACI|nr:SDR family oxidoreductase [Metabacillus iocasae]MBM7701932.1 3-oxoacyl-[acyl-carrier protein] reductase [Metabacillus iocasae]